MLGDNFFAFLINQMRVMKKPDDELLVDWDEVKRLFEEWLQTQ